MKNKAVSKIFFSQIDNVDRPSWQAQISGSKTWYLVPSVECADICHDLAVTVKKGDIGKYDNCSF